MIFAKSGHWMAAFCCRYSGSDAALKPVAGAFEYELIGM